MKTFLSFVFKETKHILRDPRTMLILFGMPVVMMLLFGFAISTDVRSVRTVVVTSSMDDATRRLVDRLDASEYFDIVSLTATPAQAKQQMRDMKADMAVVFSPSFAQHRYDGTASVQLLMGGADPNMSLQQATYASQILQSAVGISGAAVHTKLLYNPRMKSAYNFVPGIMGLLLLVICAMMTSVSIVREKERGTMEVLLVSPVRAVLVLIAKVVPYLLLSLGIVGIILLIAHYVLDVPVAGSLTAIYGVTMLYILLALGLGLLISVVADTQLAALLGSGMVLLMPSLLLSGMIYPVESMATILQYISLIVPARWYIDAIRKLMIMGVGIDMVLENILILSAMALLFITIALKKFKKRLE
uniref:Transport permease protein n=1 Tax=Prevotella sp. GTC17259 TaxID=3236795 RepID=A0AB33JFT4_9BACT